MSSTREWGDNDMLKGREVFGSRGRMRRIRQFVTRRSSC